MHGPMENGKSDKGSSTELRTWGLERKGITYLPDISRHFAWVSCHLYKYRGYESAFECSRLDLQVHHQV